MGQDHDIHAILKERGEVYGPFDEHAHATQDLKERLRQYPLWEACTRPQREALDMLMHKIGRLNGNPHYKDTWVDMEGYIRLVVETLE